MSRRTGLPVYGLFLAACMHPGQARGLVREPAVAGRFYPDGPETLKSQVDALLAKAKPADLGGELVAVLVPHAGLEFSGAAAAQSFAQLKPGQFDSVLVIGTGHFHPVEGAALYPGAYATPLGRAEYDAALASALKKASTLIVESEAAHQGEHSIEVEVPFLLRRLGAFKMVAMVMNTQELDTAIEVGKAVAKAVKGKKVLLVASSDLSHYPAGGDADKVDETTMLALEALDPAFFWLTNRLLMGRGVLRLDTAWCGEGAVAAVAAAARELGARRLVRLARYHSGNVIPERADAVVGYAAAAFVRGPARRAAAYRLREEDKRLLLSRARETIRRQLEGIAPLPVPLSSVPGLNLPAAVFATLYKTGPSGAKELRGCVGSVQPESSLLEAASRFAAAAAFEDRRFQPLAKEELDLARIELSLLSPRRRVSGPGEIRHGDGVTVEKEGRLGVLLPQAWEKIPDKTAFLAILCAEKAGLPKDCYRDPGAQLSVFSVETFEEKP